MESVELSLTLKLNTRKVKQIFYRGICPFCGWQSRTPAESTGKQSLFQHLNQKHPERDMLDVLRTAQRKGGVRFERCI